MSTIADITARDAVTQARHVRRRFPAFDPHTLSIVLLGVLAAFILATFADYGVSWDERVQNTYGLHLL
ncbi:MAG TPA: hypothetical protein VMJ74_17115, partial [Pseudomonadales bacterium]|nr:hypothetical protein [Pseudomonadales bacterium]